MIAVNKCSIFLFAYVSLFSLDLDFFSVHIDKVLVWQRLRKIDVLKESFSKTLLYITEGVFT